MKSPDNKCTEYRAAKNIVEILVEHFWFHDDPDIQKSFREYTRFREREEDKYPEGAFQESAELLEQEKAFASHLSGLETQAYLLLRRAMELSVNPPSPECNRP